MNYLLLRLVYLLNPLWRKMGADTAQLKMILEVKTKMGDRLPMLASAKNKKETHATTVSTGKKIGNIIVPILIGLLYCIYFVINESYLQTGIFFNAGIMILMSAMFMVIQFTTSLLNVDDFTILCPRPVNHATILLSRTLYFLILYVGYNMLMVTASIICLGFLLSPLKALYSMLLYVMLFVFVFCVIQFVIFLLLRYLSASSFKRFMPWLQGGMLILIYFTIYGSNKIDFFKEDIFSKFSHSAIQYFLPNYWFAAILMGKANFTHYILFFGVPILLLFVTIKYLSASFFTQINSAEQTTIPVSIPFFKKKKTASKPRSTWFFRHDAQKRAFYVFAQKFIARDSAYRMAVLPNFIYIIFLNFKTFMAIYDYAVGKIETLKIVDVVLPFYILAYPMLLALLSLSMSSSYKASWSIVSAPVQHKGIAYQGMFLAVLKKYFLIIAVPFAVIALLLKPEAWANVLLAFLNSILISLMNAFFFFNNYIASEPPQSESDGKGKGRSFVRMILVFIISIVLGGLHIFILANTYWWGLLTLSFISFGLMYLFWDMLGKKQ